MMNDKQSSTKIAKNRGRIENLTNTGKGRPKGASNKTTALLKDAILLAAQNAGGGGPDGIATYLCKQAIENPAPFMSLLGKVLPTQVTGEDGGAIKIDDASADEAKRKLVAFLATGTGRALDK